MRYRVTLALDGQASIAIHQCTSSAEASVMACGLRGMLADAIRVAVKIGTLEEVLVDRGTPPGDLEVRLRQRGEKS